MNFIPIIGPVLGGCIAASAGCWLAWWRWQRDGRDRFLAVIGELDAKLDGCGHLDSRTQVFHTNSLNPLRSAIFAVQPFLRKGSFNRLLDLWHQYEKEDPSGGVGLEKRISHELQHGAQSPTMPPYADEMLRGYLKKFRVEVH